MSGKQGKQNGMIMIVMRHTVEKMEIRMQLKDLPLDSR